MPCIKLGNRQNTELNVESKGLGVLRYCLDRGDGCNKLIHYVGNYLPQMTSHPRRLKPTSCEAAWKPLHMLE